MLILLHYFELIICFYSQEFLKKEFSHENIYFWVACERYRWLEGVEGRQQAAQEIFERHLAPGAPEPVNVDSQARQVSPAQLQLAQPTLFLQVCTFCLIHLL